MNDHDAVPAQAEILEQIAALQRQVFTLLLVLIVVSGTLVAFLYYQNRQLGKSVDGYVQVTQSYKQNFPIIQAFVKEATLYGASHPDFQLILKKYGIPNTPPAAPAPKK